MKKSLLGFLGLIVVSYFQIDSSCAQIVQVKSKKDTVIVVDGKDNEWGANFTYDKNSKLQYALSKDDNNLYICLKAKNPNLEKKIKTFGLTLWIDTTGKHKENMGIKFPIGNKEKNKSLNDKNKRTEAEDRELFLKNSQEMEVKGFSVLGEYGNEFTRLGSKSKLGIHGFIAFDTLNTMVYELKIPLNVIFQGNTPKTIALNFITGSQDLDNRREQLDNGNKPGSVTTGMSGYASGGGGNLSRVPGDKEYFTLSEPSELKLKVSLLSK